MDVLLVAILQVQAKFFILYIIFIRKNTMHYVAHCTL